MAGTLNPYPGWQYTGANGASGTFIKRWQSKEYVGKAKPWVRVSIRRGFMKHKFHYADNGNLTDGWPGEHAPLTVRGRVPRQFGRILGLPMYPQWYPDWTPTSDWVTLPGISQVQLEQSVNFAGESGGDGSGGAGGGTNGIAVSTITCDNAAWIEVAGALGAYHQKQRGWLWPWRGYVPTKRPGGSVSDQNIWYDKLPNAQILVEQGYGSDTSIKTFTGLIDTIGPASLRPDQTTLAARDFGGILADVNPFSWNKDIRLKDPMYFIPPDYPNIPVISKNGSHNWVIVHDATDIVRCALRWCGFKEWQIEMSGVGLKTAFLVDRSQKWIDVINQVASQLGHVFFIAEPTSDDLSIGMPVFRKQSVVHHYGNRRNPRVIDSTMLTDIQPKHDNTNDRHTIRVRGRFAKRVQGGRPIIGGDMNEDGQVLFTFQYWPPWIKNMAGVIKQLTYYNIGSNGLLGFSSDWECEVACLQIAVQIALTRDMATVQFPANPGVGLDSFAFINDPKASGIVSRLYVTGRTSTMTVVQSGASQGGGSSESTELLWSSEVGGSLVDNPEWEKIVADYQTALSGGNVVTGGETGVAS